MAAPLKGVPGQAPLRPDASALRAGRAVALDGEWAFLGAPDSEEFGQGAGAVYVFRLVGGGWVQQSTIHSATPAPYEHFGAALSLDQGRLAVASAGSSVEEQALGGNANAQLSVWHLDTTSQLWEHEPVSLFLESGADPRALSVSLSGEYLTASSSEGTVITRVYHLATIPNLAWYDEIVDGGPAFPRSALDASQSPRLAIIAGGDIRLYQRKQEASFAHWAEEKLLSQADKLDASCRLAWRGTWLMVNCPGSNGYVKFVHTDGTESAKFAATSGTTFEHALTLGDTRAAVIESKKDEQRVRFFALAGQAWQEDGAQVTSASADQTGGLALRESGSQAQILTGRPGENRSGKLSGDGALLRRDAGGWALDPALPPLAVHPYVGGGFGAALALDGNTLVVGLPEASDYDPDLGPNLVVQPQAGRVDIYLRQDASSPWTYAQSLRSPGVAAGGRFGAAVALTEATLVVGAPADGTGTFFEAGNVYIYNRQPGDLSQPVIPNVIETLSPNLSEIGASTPHFGATLAVEFTSSEPSPGGRLVVGAPSSQYFGNTDDVGFAFSYPLDSSGETNGYSKWWSGAQQPVRFGESVAIHGDRILIGAPRTAASGAGNGAVYDINTLTPGDQKLLYQKDAPAPTGNGFGTRMALQGDRLLVSAVGAGTPESPGSVSIHRYDASKLQWTDGQTLGDNAVGRGRQLALDGDLAAVTEGPPSAPVVRLYHNDAGSTGDDWKPQVSLTLSSPSPLFGGALVLQESSAMVLVGDPGDGSVTVWELGEAQGAPCVVSTDCNPTPTGATELFCVDGVCCNAACGGSNTDDCQVCAKSLGAEQDGTCSPAPLDTACSTPNGDGTCDAAGLCVAGTGGQGGEGGAGGMGGAGMGGAGMGGAGMGGAGMSGASGQGGEASVPDLWVGVDKGAAGAPVSAGGATSAGGQGGVESQRPPQPNESVPASDYPDGGCSVSVVRGPGGPGALLALGTALTALAARRRRAA